MYAISPLNMILSRDIIAMLILAWDLLTIASCVPFTLSDSTHVPVFANFGITNDALPEAKSHVLISRGRVFALVEFLR